MASRQKIFNSLYSLTIFIIMEIVALNIMYRSGNGQEFFLTKFSQPFVKAFWGLSQGIGDYFSLKGINEDLAKENFALLTALTAAGVDTTAAREGVGAQSAIIGKFRYTRASVVKISTNKHHNYLILDKGARDSITARSGVITPFGVVGIIDTVSNGYAFARSFQNHNFNLSVRIGKEGTTGPLSWNGKSGAVLRDISLHFPFRIGDTVYTSGLSTIFPPDIPLGIIKEDRISNGSTREFDVDLFQDYSSIRFVTVVSNTEREEILDLERKEAGR